MSALLAALQRLEGRTPTSSPPLAAAPETAPMPVFMPEPFFASLVEPVRSAGWDEVSLPTEMLPVDEVVSAAAEAVVPPVAVQIAERDDGTAALVRILPSPALAAVVAVGVTGEMLSLLRGFGEALSARTTTDVVLLGPGMLDDAAALTAQWNALRPHVGYGLVHATAERATLRLDALRQTAGVIAVIELGRTPVTAVAAVRKLLADRDIPLLGTLAIRDE